MSFTLTPSLDLIIGPMRGGKTTELLRMLNTFAELGLKTLYVNSNLDTRSDANFSTHNPSLKSIGKIQAIKTSNLCNVAFEEYKVIGIDEAQFFPALKNYVTANVNKGKKIIVAGLNGDYQRNPFGEINELIPYCDTIKFLRPFCKLCTNKITPASFTKRISPETNTISVDAEYLPVCRSCYA